MENYVTAEGVRVVDEDYVEVLTEARKVRPARGAFGDWNAFDADGNPTLRVIGSSVLVSEDDDLANNWGYATSQEERKAERGDDPEYDASMGVWYNKKGDRVQFGTERTYRTQERAYSYTPGYHRESDGIVTCWYCATTFSARYFIMQSEGGTLTRPAMEAFAIACILHTTECKAAHDGFPLIRLVDGNGRGYLRRAQYQWVKDLAIKNWLAAKGE